MVPWKKYLTEVVTIFRRQAGKLDPESQKRIRKVFRGRLLFEPCQIEVLDLKAKGFVVFLISHDKKLPDMTFEIHENAKSTDESKFLKKYEYKLIEQFGLSAFFGWGHALNEPWIIVMEDSVSVEQEMSSQGLADYIFKSVREELKNAQVDVIERSTSGLKESIAKIPKKETREELLVTTSKIDGALQEIKRLDKEIGKVRQLMGVSQEYQDWKLLVSDVYRLKGEHVPREIFNTHIKRLDEKIDTGIKALDERIEDLKAIKFWSKRTLLEIALAIWGTIVTAYATGILKF